MAEETVPGSEEMEPVEAAAAPEPTPAPDAPAETGGDGGGRGDDSQPWGAPLLGLALLAVLLTLMGVYGQVQKKPNHLPLGLGLVLWGLLDLAAQRRGLIVWKGAKALLGSTVNLARGMAVLAMGVWLCLMAMDVVKPVTTAQVTSAGVVLMAAYLGTALVLDMMVKGLRLSGQAFLLGALILSVLSHLYFAIPFTFSWSAVCAGLAFGMAAWAVYAGALEQSPALSRAVLLAVLGLSAPLGLYTAQQMFFTVEQPLFTPTLLIPRMRQVVGDLGEKAGQITWAPVHSQSSQPGDIPFSDKIAFTDRRDGKPGVGLFLQRDDGKGMLAWMESGEDARLTGFSPDGKVLALTQIRKGGKEPSLAVLEPVSPKELAAARQAAEAAALAEEPKGKKQSDEARKLKEKAALAADQAPYRMKTLYTASVAEGPEHGQVWRSQSRELYFAAPHNSLREGNSAVLRADLERRQVTRLREGRGLPAVSADGAALLSVGFSPNERYLEMADGTEGKRDPRRFQHRRETRYFPAWNSGQTRVLFLAKDGTLMIMNSNGTAKRPFDPSDPEDLNSKVWYSDKLLPFTLQWQESGDIFRVWNSRPDGSGEKLLYEVRARSISAPQWSPDGGRVAFIIEDDAGSSILTVGADGSWPRRFFTTADTLSELKWSHDSLRLAWICGRVKQDEHEVWTAGVEGLEPVRVHSSPGRLSSLGWSPQNAHLAVEETREWRVFGLRLIAPDLHNVLMIDLSDRQARVMTRYGLMSRQPAFSPQGVAIGYFTDQRPWHPGLLRERSSALVISQLF